MANIRIAAVGAMVLYAAEATAGGGVPSASASWHKFVDVVEAPAVEVTQEMTDASSVTEKMRTYVKGHTDHTQNGTLNLNHTEAAITAYESAKSVCNTAEASGKKFYLQYFFPEGTKAYFYAATLGELGTEGINENAVNIPAPIGIGEVLGWQTKIASADA